MATRWKREFIRLGYAVRGRKSGPTDEYSELPDPGVGENWVEEFREMMGADNEKIAETDKYMDSLDFDN